MPRFMTIKTSGLVFLFALLLLMPNHAAANKAAGVGDVNGDGYEDYIRGTEASVVGHVFDFDGSDAHFAQFKNVTDNATKTVSLWVYPTSASLIVLLDFGAWHVQIFDKQVRLTEWELREGGGLASNRNQSINHTYSLLNRWNHIAMSNNTIWINGQATTLTTPINVNMNNVIVGGYNLYPDNTRTPFYTFPELHGGFKGQISQIALTDEISSSQFNSSLLLPIDSDSRLNALFRPTPGSTSTSISSSVAHRTGHGNLTLTTVKQSANTRQASDCYLELAGPSPKRVEFRGGITRGFTGWSASGIGDVNGDGYPDFAIGAPMADNAGSQNAGVVYVVYGTPSFTNNQVINLEAMDVSVGTRISGGAKDQYLGYSVAGAGDTNGDGIADFLVGAPGVLQGGQAVGAAYLIYGVPGVIGSGGTLPISRIGDSLDKGISGTKLTVINETTGSTAKRYMVGAMVSGVGDTNGDGYDDFLVGAPGRYLSSGAYLSGTRGENFLIFGRPLLEGRGTADTTGIGTNGVLDLAKMVDGSIQRGVEFADGETGMFGWDGAGMGDVDRDGYSDFAMGNNSRALVIHGVPAAPRSLESGISTGNPLDPEYRRSIVTNSDLGRGFMTGIAGAGDINGDGLFDGIFGDPAYSAKGGAARVLFPLPYWAANTFLKNFNNPQYSDSTDGGLFGYSVSTAGDNNGDGTSDILIGRANGAPQVVLSPAITSARLGATAYWGFDETSGNTVTEYFSGTTATMSGTASWTEGVVGNAANMSGNTLSYSGIDLPVGQGAFTISTWIKPRSLGTQYILTWGNNHINGLILHNNQVVNHWFGGGTDLGATFDSTRLNKWSHVAVTYDGWTRIMYIDGVAVASDFQTANVGAGDVAIGLSLNGLLDDLTVFKRSLEAWEIKALIERSARFRDFSPNGFGELIGELQLWKEIPVRPVGSTKDGTHSIPASRISLGFKGGGQGGAQRASTQEVTLFRQSAPKPYVADEGGPNQRTFKTPAMFWHLDTDRRRFSESTIHFFVPGSFLSSLTALERDRIGIFYSKIDPLSGTAKASDWVPLPGSVAELGGSRIKLHRTHDSAAGFPSPAEVDFDGYYAIFVGEATYNLGTEIRPPAVVDIDKLPSTGPLVSPGGVAWWHVEHKKLYAIAPSSNTLVRWIDDTDASKRTQADQLCSLVWPGDLNSVSTASKAHFDYYVAGSPEANLDAAGDDVVLSNVTLTATETNADSNTVSAEKRFFATNTGRSMLMLSPGDPRLEEIYFLFLWTLPFDNADRFTADAVVGTNLSRLGEVQGLHDSNFGSPWFRNATGYISGDAGYYNPSAFPKTGPIIPVNVDLTANDPSDNFDLVYFKKATRLKNARTQTLDTGFDLFLPWKSASYTLSWPANAPLISIPGGTGTGPLAADRYITPSLYVQNTALIDPDGRPNNGDETRPLGFNPNDEHTVQLNVGGLPSFFPLRNDLGSAGTSLPYVVVKHVDSSENDLIYRQLGASAYWTFDEGSGTTVREAIGGKTASVPAGTTWVEGRVGRAIRLPGTGKISYLDADFPDLPVGSEPYTVSVWLNPAVLSGDRIVIEWGTVAANRWWGLMLRGTSLLNYWHSNDLTTSVANDLVNQWWHLAASFDGTTRRLYVNGTQIASDTPTGKDTARTALNIGVNFSGSLDELSIFKRALTPAEIAQVKNLRGQETPAIAVWKVDTGVTFDYTASPIKVGTLIIPPSPLNNAIFPPAPAAPGETDGSHTENTTNVWTDRDGRHWAISAGATESGTIDVVMRYYYITRPDFYMPAEFRAALIAAGLTVDEGARLPWLSNWKSTDTATIRKPASVTMRLRWPARNEVPTMFYAETLVRPKRGLPAIEGQASVEILATMASETVKLIDPTVERSTLLSPTEKADVEKLKLATLPGGRREFEDLAPHLRRRLLYDPAQGKLIWRGQYIPFVTGEDMLLPNVMTTRERDQAIAIGTPATTTWDQTMRRLATSASAVHLIESSDEPFDTLALTAAGARNPGFVTLGFNNKQDAAGAVSVEVIYVDDELWKGDAKVIYPECPFVEQVSLRHNGDFAGQTDSYDFDWYYMQSATYFSLRTQLGEEPYAPTDTRWGVGVAPPNPWTRMLRTDTSRRGAVDIVVDATTVGNDGVLGDLIWSVSYKSRSPLQVLTSGFTDVDLTEGWVKRVVGDFGPLRQRAVGGGIQGAEDAFEDFRNRTVNTLVSMIAQIGRRWEGSVPLTCSNVDGLGLIEVYQTVLNRAKALSINAAPPAIASDTVVDTLLLAASRLADMYALLGNEAFADASDPTIVMTAGGTGIALNSSIHPFMNQVPTVLEEELALLRGRDDQRLPSVRVQPFYNRLVWNFTTDASGGDVAYALNYAITDQNQDGLIDELDASKLFPQSHGDAWGHLLSGMKTYYLLIRSPEFIWVPRQEAVLVGGTPVEVDFYDERKFATLAAAKSRVGREIVNLTYRASYTENPALQWQGYRDTRSERAWGVSEWGSRAAIGARLDWIVGNALLPADDGTTDERDITKINRRTVAELGEVASNFSAIQEELDRADAGMNPLGIARDAVPFDINPASLESDGDAEPVTHFEQIFARATNALENASEVFQYAQGASIALREQADEVGEFRTAVGDSEFDYETRLIEFFGTPYPNDIGPTGTYASGYNGPDLIHYMYLDRNQLGEGMNGVPSSSVTVNVLTGPELAKLESGENFDWSNGAVNPIVPTEAGKTRAVTYHFVEGFGNVAPDEWKTPRRVAGQLQLSNLAVVGAMNELRTKVDAYSGFLDEFRTEVRLFQTRYNIKAQEIKITTDTNQALDNLGAGILSAGIVERGFTDLRDMVELSLDAAGDAAPRAVGLAIDVGAGVRSILSSVRAINNTLFTSLAGVAAHTAAGLEYRQGVVERNAGLRLQVTGANLEIQEALAGLRSKYIEESGYRLEIAQLAHQVQQAAAEYSAVLGSAERLIEERARFRRTTAASTQDYRHKDMMFRIFRNDAVQKYRAQFDLAARMVYLAAKAYDYETNLLGTDTNSGQAFLSQIVRTRSIGRLGSNGMPLVASSSGDPGLADGMARMRLNWDLVVKSQLGFNNPATEGSRFSLREELFRSTSTTKWQEALSRPYGKGNASGFVPNVLDLPAFRRYAVPFAGDTLASEPAIVIRFGTNVNFGQNFFVSLDAGTHSGPRLLGGGDSAYSSANFATKVRGSGIWFVNYNNLAGAGMSNTPILYLFPSGIDKMRSPTGDRTKVRSFKVMDQAIPIPFPLSGSALAQSDWSPTVNSLSDSFVTIRRFAPFRAYHDSGDSEAEFDSEAISVNSRLVGRSVWNTEWYLIIPAGTLHSDRYEGLHRFLYGQLLDPQPQAGTTPAEGMQIQRLDNGQTEWRDGNGVSDILLYFQTYAYEGI